jgi:hypothetical protein
MPFFINANPLLAFADVATALFINTMHTPTPASLCASRRRTATPNGATARVRMAEVVRAWWAAWNIDHGAAAAESTSAAKTATLSGVTPSGAMHAGDKCPPPRLSHQGARSRLPRSTDPIATAVSLLSADFRLCDAYGLWPAMRTLGQRYLHRDAALHHLARMRYGHNLSMTVHDIAVAEGSLATFTHWTARVTPRWCDHDHGHHHDGGEHCSSGADQQQPQSPGLAAAGEEEVLEGIEVSTQTHTFTHTHTQREREREKEHHMTRLHGGWLVPGVGIMMRSCVGGIPHTYIVEQKSGKHQASLTHHAPPLPLPLP